MAREHTPGPQRRCAEGAATYAPRPMDVPLLVDDFLRRAADLYPDKTAIVDGPKRFRYRDWRARVNQLSHALLAARRAARATGSASSRRTPTTSWRASTPPARSGAMLVPLNYRLLGGGPRVHPRPRGRRRSRSSTPPTRRPSTRSARASRASATGSRRPAAGAAIPPGWVDFDAWVARRVGRAAARLAAARGERRRLAQLHLGHDGAAQGRDAHAPQLLPERLQPDRPPRHPPRGRRALDAADVPLQRLGRRLRADRDGRHPRRAARRRRAPRSSA